MGKDETHECDNPIHCSTCIAEKATRATARRTAARKAAATRKRNKGREMGRD